MHLRCHAAWRLLFVSAGAAACDGAPASPATALATSPAARTMLQAAWETAHEGSDAVAVSYALEKPPPHVAVGSTPDQRDACWRGGLDPARVVGQAAAGSDANLQVPLTFAGTGCRIGDRVLVGAQVLDVRVNISPLTREVRQSGAWQIALAGGGQWQVAPAALGGQAALAAQLADGDIAHGHFRIALGARRQVIDADGRVTSLQVTSPPTSQGGALTVAEVADVSGLRLAVHRTLEAGSVTVVDAGAGVTAAHAFTGLATDYAQGCLCPSAGVVVQTLSGGQEETAQHTYTFSACGLATVVSSSTQGAATATSVSTVSFAACQ